MSPWLSSALGPNSTVRARRASGSEVSSTEISTACLVPIGGRGRTAGLSRSYELILRCHGRPKTSGLPRPPSKHVKLATRKVRIRFLKGRRFLCGRELDQSPTDRWIKHGNFRLPRERTRVSARCLNKSRPVRAARYISGSPSPSSGHPASPEADKVTLRHAGPAPPHRHRPSPRRIPRHPA